MSRETNKEAGSKKVLKLEDSINKRTRLILLFAIVAFIIILILALISYYIKRLNG